MHFFTRRIKMPNSFSMSVVAFLRCNNNSLVQNEFCSSVDLEQPWNKIGKIKNNSISFERFANSFFCSVFVLFRILWRCQTEANEYWVLQYLFFASVRLVMREENRRHSRNVRAKWGKWEKCETKSERAEESCKHNKPAFLCSIKQPKFCRFFHFKKIFKIITNKLAILLTIIWKEFKPSFYSKENENHSRFSPASSAQNVASLLTKTSRTCWIGKR